MMPKNSFSIVAALLAISLLTPSSFGQDSTTTFFDFAPFNPDQVQFSADLLYFQSTANYDDSGGSFEALDDGHSFSEINMRLRGSYDIAPLWRVVGGARVNSVTTEDDVDSRTNSELNEVQLGLVFAPVYQLTQRIYLEAFGTAALNSVETNTDNAITGEGANRFRVGARYAYLLGSLEFLSSLHFDYLDDGRSSRLPYAVGAKWHLNNLGIYGGVQGFFSATNDEFSETPQQRNIVTDRVNGGSFRYYGIDPALLETQAHVDWMMSEGVNLSLGISKTLNGTNAAEGFGVIAGLAFRWGGTDDSVKKKGSVRKRRIRRRRGGRLELDEDFELREEQYDEELFEKRQRKNRKKKRRRKKRRPIDVDGAIESTIEDLE